MDLSAEFVAHVEEHFPRGFFVRLFEEFELDYSDALDSCLRRFDREEAMDLLPYERRARNETSLRVVAREFSHRGIRATPEPNVTNSNYHTEVVSGPVVLTASFVQHPGDLVRMADFRGTLAQNRQESLIPRQLSTGDRFYAILIHGNKRIEKVRYHSVLGFFEMAVPNDLCNDYLDRPANLAARYANDDVDPADVEAAAKNGIRYEHVRRPSTLLREYRKLQGYGS